MSSRHTSECGTEWMHKVCGWSVLGEWRDVPALSSRNDSSSGRSVRVHTMCVWLFVDSWVTSLYELCGWVLLEGRIDMSAMCVEHVLE